MYFVCERYGIIYKLLIVNLLIVEQVLRVKWLIIRRIVRWNDEHTNE